MSRKRVKVLTAGRVMVGVCYTPPTRSDAPAARRAKEKVSSAARQKLNFRAAWQKLWLIIAATFPEGALWCTVTYDDAHLPPNRKAAKKEMAAFWDRMRAAWKRSGMELAYIYCTHEILDNGERRLHHHFLMSQMPDGHDVELIRSLWTGGSNIEVRVVGGKGAYPVDDLQDLARYMLHERNPELTSHATGDRGYCCSKTCKRPVEESYTVDGTETIGVPPGAYVIDRVSVCNQFGGYDYLYCILPKPPARTRRRPKKRRSSTAIS